jgi:hypothetical protein
MAATPGSKPEAKAVKLAVAAMMLEEESAQVGSALVADE